MKQLFHSPVTKSAIFCILFTVLIVLFSYLKPFIPAQFERAAHATIGTIAAVVATAIFLRIDKRSFASIGLQWERGTIKRFLAGTGIGLVLMGGISVAVLYAQQAQVTLNSDFSLLPFLFIILPLVPMAWFEEAGFRAYPLEILKEKTDIRFTLIFTSLLFALYHIANGWSVAASFLGPGIWGLIFGLAAIYSHGIAMPTGLHFAANFTTTMFGVAGDKHSFFTIQSVQSAGPSADIDWLTIVPSGFLLMIAVAGMTRIVRRGV